jgi:hypothetical protein
MFSVRNAEATPGGRPVALRFADDARGCCVHAWEEHLTNSPGWLHSVLVFAKPFSVQFANSIRSELSTVSVRP